MICWSRSPSLTDGPTSPLAANSRVKLYVDAGAASAFQPISAAIGLVQTLVTALTWTAPNAE